MSICQPWIAYATLSHLMPEKRLQRTRDAYEHFDFDVYRTERRLPNMFSVHTMSASEGAQRLADWVDARAAQYAYGKMVEWRRPSDNAAEQLAKRGVTANVIEGEQH